MKENKTFSLLRNLHKEVMFVTSEFILFTIVPLKYQIILRYKLRSEKSLI
jgi:hypothetical protein